MSVRDSYNKKPVTQAEVDALMANEPDVLPAYGGAGSMATHLKRASKQYRPADARARLTAAERQQFAAENQEVIPMTPEEEAHVLAEVDRGVKSHEFREYFQKAVRNRVPLIEAWNNSGIDGECPFFTGVERDGDPVGANKNLVRESMLTFADCPAFAAYRSRDEKSPRYKVQRQVMDLLWEFQVVNLVNMTLAQSWLTCFQLLQNIGVLPAPLPTSEQLQAAERNKPADDGNPVYINDATGEPVTYKFKDGRIVRYSKQMLDQLNSESYAKVMNLRAVPKETEEERRARKAKEYRTVPVIQGYTQQQLDSMPSEKYRQLLQLERNGGGKVGDRL